MGSMVSAMPATLASTGVAGGAGVLGAGTLLLAGGGLLLVRRLRPRSGRA